MKKAAVGLASLAGILWGILGLFVRTLNAAGLEAMQIVELRACVTAAVLLAALLIARRDLLKIRIRDLWCFLGTGICSIVFFNACYFRTVHDTSLSVAAVLLYTAPVFVMVLSAILFHEKITGIKIMAIIMTVAGCVLVTGVWRDAGGISGMNLLIGLGAGLGYALYSIFGRFALERGYSTVTVTFYTFLVAALFSMLLENPVMVFGTAFSGPGLGAVSISLGVLCTIAPFLSYTIALQYIENSRASVIASVEPVTATILGAVVYGEKLTVSGVLGIAVVIGALVLVNITDGKALSGKTQDSSAEQA